jgi:septation ring formation regulator EzrA
MVVMVVMVVVVVVVVFGLCMLSRRNNVSWIQQAT